MPYVIEGDVRRFVENGTGNPVPANTSLYDALTPKSYLIDGLDLGAVVQNTWYPALNVANAEVSLFAFKITVADETVEARVTIDGVLWTNIGSVNLLFAGNAISQIDYLRISTGGRGIHLSAAASSVDSLATVFPILRGRSILIEVRKTTNAGASHLIVYSTYTSR